MLEYQMVQIPQQVSQAASRRKRTDREAADYLQNLANEMAADGWKFDGLEGMEVVTPPGCLGFGQPARRAVYVATFKREKKAMMGSTIVAIVPDGRLGGSCVSAVVGFRGWQASSE